MGVSFTNKKILIRRRVASIYISIKIYSPDAVHVCWFRLSFCNLFQNIPTFTRVVGNDFKNFIVESVSF